MSKGIEELTSSEIIALANQDHAAIPLLQQQQDAWGKTHELAALVSEIIRSTVQNNFTDANASAVHALVEESVNSVNSLKQLAPVAKAHETSLGSAADEAQRFKDAIDTLAGELSDAQNAHREDPEIAFQSYNGASDGESGFAAYLSDVTADMRTELRYTSGVYETEARTQQEFHPRPFSGMGEWTGPRPKDMPRNLGTGPDGPWYRPLPGSGSPTGEMPSSPSGAPTSSSGPSLQSAGVSTPAPPLGGGPPITGGPGIAPVGGGPVPTVPGGMPVGGAPPTGGPGRPPATPPAGRYGGTPVRPGTPPTPGARPTPNLPMRPGAGPGAAPGRGGPGTAPMRPSTMPAGSGPGGRAMPGGPGGPRPVQSGPGGPSGRAMPGSPGGRAMPGGPGGPRPVQSGPGGPSGRAMPGGTNPGGRPPTARPAGAPGQQPSNRATSPTGRPGMAPNPGRMPGGKPATGASPVRPPASPGGRGSGPGGTSPFTATRKTVPPVIGGRNSGATAPTGHRQGKVITSVTNGGKGPAHRPGSLTTNGGRWTNQPQRPSGEVKSGKVIGSRSPSAKGGKVDQREELRRRAEERRRFMERKAAERRGEKTIEDDPNAVHLQPGGLLEGLSMTAVPGVIRGTRTH